MITQQEVDDQLKRLDVRFKFWGHPEMLELKHILIPGEQIRHCLNGQYEGGFAMICATDQRLLVIDKKIFHLFVEDIRYDMISEVDYSAQIMTASVKVCTPTKNLVFTTFKPKQLRALASFVQQRVLEIRQQYAYQDTSQDFQTAQSAAQALQAAPLLQQTTEPVAATSTLRAAKNVTADKVGTLATKVARFTTQTVPGLPPRPFKNPYIPQGPLLMRRRIGRFGPTPTTR